MDLPQMSAISQEEIAAHRARVDEAWNILARDFTAASLPHALAYSLKLVVQTEVTLAISMHLVAMNKMLEEALALIQKTRKG